MSRVAPLAPPRDCGGGTPRSRRALRRSCRYSASQAPARERDLASFAGRPEPDIVVSHQAAALTEDVPGRLRVHGHGHVPQLDGNRVQVGTITGGGSLSHFITGPDAVSVPGLGQVASVRKAA